MTSYGSMVQTLQSSSIKYPFASIFFEPAEYNLHEYLREPTNEPNNDLGRLRNVQQMLSICHGLVWLSETLTYVPEDDQYVYQTYYHQDLKPENILVCKDCYGDGVPFVFKIADFGQAKNLRQLSQAKQGRKRKDLAIPVSGRERTYLAPEVQRTSNAPEVKANSDVWPFGCIFLLVIIFNYYGPTTLNEFQQHRTKESDPDNPSDTFVHQTGHGTDVRNRAVNEMIESLMKEANQEDRKHQRDNKFTREFLHYLEGSILVHYKHRQPISDVSEKLRELYNDREPLRPQEQSYESIQGKPRNCVALQGGQVVFYSPGNIWVYSDDSKNPRSIRPRPMEQKWSDNLRVTSRSCSGNAIAVAAELGETSDSFNVGILKIQMIKYITNYLVVHNS
jgi:serine/threonine protein kinase